MGGIYSNGMAEYENTTIFRERERERSPKRNNQYESGHTVRHGVPAGEKDEYVLEREHQTSLKYSSIESVISNPICCGYLLQFCEAQHNSENVRFFLEVDEFRDMFAADKDKDIWEYGFEEIDNQVKFLEYARNDEGSKNNILVNGSWPSSFDKSAAINKINVILHKYLNNDSHSQVCISDPLIEQTLKRIRLLHLYGPEVFEEATREPIKTMKKDILPRFLSSDIFRRMIANVASCEPTPPPASDLKVPPPESWLLTISSLDDLPDTRRFQLDEVLNCLQLYNEFLTFLRQRVSSENLICVRMISIFEELMINNELSAAGKQAWKIYQYFVAPGAAFEVSINHIHRKHVMLEMAAPTKGMFNRIRTSIYHTLRGNFDSFMLTEQYAGLGKLMREQKLDINKLQGGGANGDVGQSSYVGCFGMRK